jgi:serine/threonine protein kinase
MENVGRYQILERLGQGGMGVVYRGFDTLLQRVVAIKLISRPIDTAPELRERFLREARSAGQLSHKNIITIYDLGEHEGQPYLAMEYLQGEDLQRRLAGPVKMSLARKVQVAIECCEALEYAHAHGVIHRDIKPSNIFLTEAGTVKIVDFGLARLMTSELTNSHMLMGTLNYMSPEQVRGARVDHRADIFSIGVVLYELLGGRKAFEGDSFASTLYKILQEVPEPLRKIDATLPEEIVIIVEKALAKPPDERYQRMTDLRQDLSSYYDQLTRTEAGAASTAYSSRPATGELASTAVTAITPLPETLDPVTPARPQSGSSPQPPMPSPSRRALTATAVLAVLAIAVAGVWFAGHRREARAPQPDSSRTNAATAVDSGAAAIALRQAAQAFNNHDYAAAQRHAEDALRTTPDNVEARDIRDRARNAAETVARGLRNARASYDANRFEDASRAAGEVLALAPDNDEAKQLMERAVAQSRGRGVDQARRRMLAAKAAARAAGAQSLAKDSYAAARLAEDDAQRLSRAGTVAEATARFYEAAGLYGSAQVTARSEAAASRARQGSTSGAPATSASQPMPRETAPPATPSATSGSEARQTPSFPPVLPPPAAEIPVPAPTSPVNKPPAPTQSAPTPAPPTPADQTPSAEDQIRDLLGRYKAALEARSLDALKRVWPGLAGAQQDAIANEFQHASRIRVDVLDPQVSVSGTTGTVHFTRRYELLTIDGQQLRSETGTTVEVRRSGSGWVIERIRFDRGR